VYCGEGEDYRSATAIDAHILLLLIAHLLLNIFHLLNPHNGCNLMDARKYRVKLENITYSMMIEVYLPDFLTTQFHHG
jgi:hypothetical protein